VILNRLGRLLLSLAAILVTLGAAQVRTQPATSKIVGTVTGDDGGHLAGVIVTAQSRLSGLSYTTTTDALGRYEIAAVAPDGDYQVRVTLSGFNTSAAETVEVPPYATLTVNFRLKLKLSEVVSVAGSPPLVNGGQSGVEQTVSDRLTHTLPLAGRNFIPLAMLTAGFTGNPNFPNPQGQMFWSNNMIVDGASHFSKWRSAARTFTSGYGLESIRDVTVLSNRFSAEYGESLATVTSAVTKSGSNDFHGTALFFFQDASLSSTPELTLVNPPSSSQRYGFTLGGPISKGRTHFFESYEGRRLRGSNPVVSPDPSAAGALATSNEDEHLAFFKVDHRLDDRQAFSARYNGQFFRWHDEPGGLTLPGSGTQYRSDVHTLFANDRLQLSDTLLNEFRAQFARFGDVRTDLRPTIYVSRAGYSQTGGALGPYGFGADPEDTWEAADTLTLLSGAHAIKFGGGTKYVRDHNAFTNYGRGAYFFGGAPLQFPEPYLFIQGVAPSAETATADPRSLSVFGFAQDDWKLQRRATLNLGLRYDIERISNVRNYSAPVDATNVQPRLGIAWEPFASQHVVIRGGAGLYTQQHLLYYINRAQLEGPGGTLTMTLAPGSPLFPSFPNVLTTLPAASSLPPLDIVVASPDFRNPHSLQATIGIERVIGDVTVSADGVYLKGLDLMSLIDSNAPASNVKPLQRSVAQADATRPIVPIAGGDRNIVSLGNLGRSWYRALQLKAVRSTGRLQALVSYTWSHAEDMDNYLLPEDSRNLDAEKATANTDVAHNLTAGFTWQLPGTPRLLEGFSLSGIGTFRSGRPYTITWGDDRNGTTQNDARPGGRNTATTDAYQNVDLALTRRFTRGTTAIDARVEAYNVFNTSNFDQYVGALLSPLYGQPVSAFSNRRVQLAAIIRF
jgi:hypothetical protein